MTSPPSSFPVRTIAWHSLKLAALLLAFFPPCSVVASRPNIIMILVDDMGYSDLGCYGGEMKTPNIDSLAQDGVRFSNAYNTSKCFPSRACLLTGVYAQQCGMGRKSGGGIQNAITLAELLRTVGYRTLAVGKHHSNKSLYDRGFDRFYGFHYGEGKSCANHFNPGKQREGEGKPARKRGETRAFCFDDKKMLPMYSPKEKDWYTTDYFTKWALNFLDEYKDEDKPYFLYVSYTAPHDPLHAWPEDIEKYDGVYDVGYEAIREARYERQKKLGLIGQEDRLSPSTHRSWNSLSGEEKQDQIRRMQVYAAMIDRVDQNIGEILEKVKALGEEDNTLILFASDNGCASGDISTGSGEVGTLTRWSSLQKDWANVSNAPFRFWKDMSYEGGICTPLIARWPAVIKQRGNINRRPVHLIDVMPTVRQITGATYPTVFNGFPVTPMQGESFLPALQGESMADRSKPLFWEWKNGAAVRDGKWKLVTRTFNRETGNARDWELYDLEVDPTEVDDLSDQHPELVEELVQSWNNWFKAAYEAETANSVTANPIHSPAPSRLDFDERLLAGAAGAAKLVESPLGGHSVSLDGKQSRLEYTLTDDWQVGARPFSLSVWIKPTSLRQAGILCGGGYGRRHGWLLDMHPDGSVRLETSNTQKSNNGSVRTSGGVLQPGHWAHVAVTVSNDQEARVFANGVQRAKGKLKGADLTNPDARLVVGGIENADNRNFHGELDRVGVFSQALTESEIEELVKPGSDLLPQLAEPVLGSDDNSSILSTGQFAPHPF